MTLSVAVALSLVVGLASLSMAGASQESQEPTQYIQVEIKGKLKTGLVAIGGESTGTVIVAKGATWELDFGNNAELKKLAETLGGKTVVVKGSYEIRPGVEVKARHIVTVTSLQEAAK